ncbi:MAG: 16S rRNA (cytosine(1402)-N(4))-methyltransferase RsmH [Planktomarina sp.]
MVDDREHIPVLIGAILDRATPVSGVWIDGTLGAGGYTRALLDAGAAKVIGIDRDPLAHKMAEDWTASYGDRFEAALTTFSKLDTVADAVDGVVLDLGVSSMQLDQADRGFSFQKDGPLDMRMGQQGRTAAELVNELDAATIADILYVFGEERASRRIAAAIVKRRDVEPFTTTLDLAEVISGQLPRPKPNQSHPATRSFQALRIAVNEEYRELADGLSAAERVLKPGGILAVVTFHSVEDRMVKRFFQNRAGTVSGSRYAPATEENPAQFDPMTRKAVAADKDEIEANPRSRSAKLRMARRTQVAPADQNNASLSMPSVQRRY